MVQAEIQGKISKHLFWDVDFTKIDFERQRDFVIPRVMDRGNKQDVMLVWEYYGEEVIKESLLSARFLEDKTIFFFANLFSISPEHFKAFNFKKIHSTNWNL